MNRFPVAAWLLLASAAGAQAPPRLQSVFPAGGKAGTTVEVVLAGVPGATGLLLFGDGLTGELDAVATAVDDSAKALFERKCATCHALRGPDNVPKAPGAWAATVERMIREKGADINDADRDRIIAYLKAKAAAGNATARIRIAADAAPGRHELRVVTPGGVTQAYPFYVSNLAEQTEVEPNDTVDQAQAVGLPAVVNGICATNGDRDFVRFEAKAGQRLTFRAEAYGLSHETQSYFSACLYVYDSAGKRLAGNLGFDDLDPLVDFTVPADGTYRVEVRDLMYRGGPGNVYRLSLGELGYHQAIYPLGARRGGTLEALIYSANQPEREWRHTFADDAALGLRQLVTPYGLFRFHLSDLPDVFDANDGQPQTITPPCVVNGWIGGDGEKDRYVIDVTDGMVTTLREWSTVGPFPVDGPAALAVALPPETEYLAGRLDAAARYSTGAEQPVTWEQKQADAGGAVAFPAGENQVWYAYRAWELREPAAATLALGTDDDCQVWLNGEVVHTFRGARPAIAASDLVPMRLRRGTNTMLIKILNRSGPGGLVAAAGAWSFEVVAERVGSPLQPRLTLWSDNNQVAASTDGPGGDPWIDWAFVKPGPFGIQIEDELGASSARHAYRLRIGPTRPTFTLRAFPSSLSVPRGGMAPLYVERDSLNGYRGDLLIKVRGLPEGLWAPDTTMPADKPRIVIPVEAEAGAPSGYGVIRVTGEVPGAEAGEAVEAEAVAYFRIQNDRLPLPQAGQVAAVSDIEAPFRITTQPDRLAVAAGQTASVAVRIERRNGFRDDITLVAVSLPDGIQATTPTVGGDRSEATIDLTFTNALRDRPLGESGTPDAYTFAVAGIVGGDGLSDGYSLCGRPIVLQPGQAPPPAPAGDRGRALFEARCGTCHQLYEPRAVRKTPDEWAQTVDRMIQQHRARVSGDERTAIVAYLQAAART